MGLLTGVFVETEEQAGAYVLKETVDEKPHFRLVESRPVVIAPSRAFIQPKAEISTPVLNIPWEEIVDNLPQISLDKKSSVLYDLQGRRTTAHQPGIYILTGGKKVLLK